MYPIKLCLDPQSFSAKPCADVIEDISARIGMYPTQINNRTELDDFITKVSTQGYTFCPATFSDNHRRQASFNQQQFIAMDFDNDKPEKSVTFDEVMSRAKYYDLQPLFAYHSLRSTPDHPKFRVVFLNDASVPDPRVATAMQLAMGEIFPEADKSCYTDISKMYFGDNVGLLSPVGCVFLALSVAEAPGRLNEPFVPHVKRPPGLMSLLLTHPAAAPSLFPSVSHSRMTATEGPCQRLASSAKQSE